MSGLDPDSADRVARSFLVVRVVRGSLVLLFLVLAAVGVLWRGWPTAYAITFGLLAVVQLGRLLRWITGFR